MSLLLVGTPTCAHMHAYAAIAFHVAAQMRLNSMHFQGTDVHPGSCPHAPKLHPSPLQHHMYPPFSHATPQVAPLSRNTTSSLRSCYTTGSPGQADPSPQPAPVPHHEEHSAAGGSGSGGSRLRPGWQQPHSNPHEPSTPLHTYPRPDSSGACGQLGLH